MAAQDFLNYPPPVSAAETPYNNPTFSNPTLSGIGLSILSTVFVTPAVNLLIPAMSFQLTGPFFPPLPAASRTSDRSSSCFGATQASRKRSLRSRKPAVWTPTSRGTIPP